MDPWERLTGVCKGIPSCLIFDGGWWRLWLSCCMARCQPQEFGWAISAVGVSGQATLGKRTPELTSFDTTGA